MGIDFDMLAQETIRLSETLALQGELPFEESIEETSDEAASVAGPGVVFYFDHGVSTYCLKGIASDDLEWEQELLVKRDPKFLDQFRLKEDWDINSFMFYPTESVIDAEIIADQILGKRFPKQEAMLCNLSDPGFSWWLREKDNEFEIYYQSQTIERDRDLVQLGPLGDPMLAERRFSVCLNLVKEMFSVNEFSSTHKSFKVSCSQRSDSGFQQFKDVFLYGRFTSDRDFGSLTHAERSFYLFIREVALLRRFWLYIEGLYS